MNLYKVCNVQVTYTPWTVVDDCHVLPQPREKEGSRANASTAASHARCRAMPCDAMRSAVMPCHVMSCDDVLSSRVLPCRLMSRDVTRRRSCSRRCTSTASRSRSSASSRGSCSRCDESDMWCCGTFCGGTERAVGRLDEHCPNHSLSRNRRAPPPPPPPPPPRPPPLLVCRDARVPGARRDRRGALRPQAGEHLPAPGDGVTVTSR